MTPTTDQRPLKGSSGLPLSGLYWGGMILLYIGERVVESENARVACAILAALGLFAAIGMRLRRAKTLQGDARAVERRILLCYVVGIAALALYAAQADFAMDRLRPMFDEARGAERYGGVLGVLWPLLFVCSMLPLLMIEISYAPMDLRRTVELRRIQRSASSGLVVGLATCLIFVLNFIGNEFDEKADLSYFKTTRPSESSKKMVANLSAPLRAVLFFPGANEVQERVQSYFDELKQSSSKLEVEVADHALHPELAKKLSVTRNGVVVLARKKQNQQISIGTKLAQAKRMLSRLDSEFQTAFFKVSRSAKIAYLTTGHEELSQQIRDDTPGTSIRDVRTLLGKLNYQVKDLGIGQGLGNEIPADASIVIIAGPKKEFIPGEVAALKKYLVSGGRALVLLDPEAGWDAAPLLSPFGLKFTPVRLANDKYHARLTYTQADRQFIFSIRFSSHPSVTTLSRNAPKAASVFLGAGYFEEQPSTEGLSPNVQFTVHSMPLTWNDANNDHTFNKDDEKRKIYEIAAAVTQKKAGMPKGKASKDDEGMRLIAIADADWLTDRVFRNPGNAYLFLDAVKWLGGEEKFVGETTSEEDVRITHTRKEDQVWFYLTIFAVPALVLGGGVLYTKRRRKRS